jgi:hypothetical protein
MISIRVQTRILQVVPPSENLAGKARVEDPQLWMGAGQRIGTER